MLSAIFHDRGGGADDPDFSVDLTWSTATIRTPEIWYIISRNCYTSQGDPDSSFPYLELWLALVAPMPYGSCDRQLWHLFPMGAVIDSCGTYALCERWWSGTYALWELWSTVVAPMPYGSCDRHSWHLCPMGAVIDTHGTYGSCDWHSW